MTVKPHPLIVSEVFEITGAGTGVFFENDPSVLLLGPVFVMVSTPLGEKLEAAASIEAARKNPPGEVLAMLFRNLKPSDIPVGSIIQIVRREPAD